MKINNLSDAGIFIIRYHDGIKFNQTFDILSDPMPWQLKTNFKSVFKGTTNDKTNN